MLSLSSLWGIEDRLPMMGFPTGIVIGFAQPALAAAATAASSALLTFGLIRLSLKLNLVANARSDRWHKQATPNTGGTAIFLSCAAACWIAFGGGRYGFIAAVGAALAVFGVIDDRIQFSPVVKLAGQSVAAALIMASGIVFRPTHTEPVNVAITFFWIVGITNAFNLIDNMDGLCAGVTVIIAIFRFFAAEQSSNAQGALALAIVAGGYLGFLIFNYKPAKIFMGDGGSMFAGFVLATLAISDPLPQTKVFVSGLFYPALTFLYPIFDTALVSVLRRLAGRPISMGGRDHSSHRLVSIGLTERRAVWLLWGLTAAGSAAGLMTAWMPIGVICVAVPLLLGATLFGIFLGTLPAYELSLQAPARSTRLRKLIPTLRAGLTIVVDVLLAGVALLCAFLFRWENHFLGTRADHASQFLFFLPIACACHGLACLVFRSFHCGWRWFGLNDVLSLAKCVVSGCALFVLTVWMLGTTSFSRGVVLFYLILLLAFASGIRLFMRLLSSMPVESPARERVAIWGASAAGELAILVCLKQGLNARPVLVLEPDPAASYTTIHGVPVRAPGNDPVRVLLEAGADALVVPLHGVLSDADRTTIELCEAAGVSVMRLAFSVQRVNELSTPQARSAPEPVVASLV